MKNTTILSIIVVKMTAMDLTMKMSESEVEYLWEAIELIDLNPADLEYYQPHQLHRLFETSLEKKMYCTQKEKNEIDVINFAKLIIMFNVNV